MKAAVPETLPGAARVARTMRSVCFLIGGLLLLVAAYGARSGWNGMRASRERMELPITLTAGTEFRAPFTTSARCDLEVQFALSRHAGVSDEAIDEALALKSNALNVDWLVQRDGKTIASGNTTNGLSISAIDAEREKSVARFKLPRSGTYELVAKVNSTRADLNSARPRLIVAPSRTYVMSASLGWSIGLFGGFVLGMIGLILILLARREHKSPMVGR